MTLPPTMPLRRWNNDLKKGDPCMEPRTFCDALNREAGDYLLATVLEGAAQGAQLLLCGGVPIWPEHPAA